MEKLTRNVVLILVTAGLVLSSASLALAQYSGYGSTMISIPGGSKVVPGGINDSGQVVGRYVDSAGNTHGFLWSGGSVTTIDCSGATLTEANGINNVGQIVGDYIDASSATHGFLLNTGGACTAIDDPSAAAYTQAMGINDSHLVVGGYTDSGGTQHGFQWDGSIYTTIDFPGATNTLATGIDQAGHIVGQYLLADDWHGFLLSHGQYFTIDSCRFGASADTLPRGINTTGEIVGECLVPGSEGGTSAYLSIGDTFLSFVISGFSPKEVSGINDSGEVAAGFGDLGGEVAFLMTPGNQLTTTEYSLPLPSLLPSPAPGFEGYDESTPILGRDAMGYYVVYTLFQMVNGSPGNASIYLQRLAAGDVSGQPTGSPVAVADSYENQYLEDASGDYIVYVLSTSQAASGDIVLYQISTGTSRNLTTTGDCSSPRIYGDYAVWLEAVSAGTQLVWYQISSGVPVQTSVMVGPTPLVHDADVGDGYIAWSQLLSGHYQVAAFDMQTGIDFLVFDNSQTNAQYVSTRGLWVAFETSSILGTGGIAIQANNPDAALNPSVASNGKANTRPTISGDLLTYESNVSGISQIYVYRLAEGDTFPVTQSTYEEHLNNILGNLVAYVDNRSGNDSVHVSSLTFVPSQPPAITSANSAALQLGQAGSFTVATTGTPTPSITESGTLPAGVTFTDNGNGTGTLGGTPAAAGAFNLIFTAQNGASPNATQNFTLTVPQGVPTVTFTGAPASAAYNSTFTVATTTDASTTATITASGVCSITGNTVTMTSGTGTCTLTANWAADNNYLAASATQSTTATAIAPTVTFTGAPGSAAYQSTFMVASTTNASTTATITASGVCSITGNTVTMTSGTGMCSLAANWAADSNYSAATLTQSTTAIKIAPTVTFTGAPPTAPYQSTFTVASTTNASTTAILTATGACSVAGTTVTMTSGTGTCSLVANWAADNNYPAASATQSTLATKITPVIAWTPASMQLGTALGAAQLDATANVPGTFTYTPPAGTVITTSSQTLSVLFTPTDGTDYTTASMSVSLTVTIGPVASVSPTSINFGTVNQGTITVKSVTVTNQGTAPMTITDPRISILSGGDSKEFLAVNLCPKSLAAGKSCTIEVIFIAGPHYNPQTATLSVMDNAPGSPQTVALSATVINPKAGTP